MEDDSIPPLQIAARVDSLCLEALELHQRGLAASACGAWDLAVSLCDGLLEEQGTGDAGEACTKSGTENGTPTRSRLAENMESPSVMHRHRDMDPVPCGGVRDNPVALQCHSSSSSDGKVQARSNSHNKPFAGALPVFNHPARERGCIHSNFDDPEEKGATLLQALVRMRRLAALLGRLVVVCDLCDHGSTVELASDVYESCRAACPPSISNVYVSSPRDADLGIMFRHKEELVVEHAAGPGFHSSQDSSGTDVDLVFCVKILAQTARLHAGALAGLGDSSGAIRLTKYAIQQAEDIADDVRLELARQQLKRLLGKTKAGAQGSRHLPVGNDVGEFPSDPDVSMELELVEGLLGDFVHQGHDRA